jgi:hypothetical protein
VSDDDELKNFYDQGFRVFSWDKTDPLADLFLIELGAYPDAAEIVIDYRAMVQDAFQAEEIRLTASGPVPRIVMEHSMISYLSCHKLSRH